MRRSAPALVLAGIVLVAGWIAASAGAQPAVPAVHQSRYAELDAALTAIEQLAAAAPGSDTFTNLSVELNTANSNRGEALLVPETWPAVLLTLDRLQEIGVSTVAVSLNFPVLAPAFPRATDYLDFYRRVAAEVRARDLRLIIETSTIFPDFSTLPVDYRGLTREQYSDEKRAMAATVYTELRPDYLTVESEPGTVTRNTGVVFTPEQFAAHVQHVTQDLTGGSTRLGAGAGTWDSLEYFRALAGVPALHYLDLHIYPITGGLVTERVPRIIEIARAAGKGLTIGESWLYKTGAAELGGTPGSEAAVFARDAFGFWAPLDQRFIAALATLGRGHGFEFVSYFWMTYLFAYVPYEERTAELSPPELTRVANQLAYRAMLEGRRSPTGDVLRALLRPAP